MAQRVIDLEASIGCLEDGSPSVHEVLLALVDDIKALWHDKGIRQAYEQRDQFQLLEQTE